MSLIKLVGNGIFLSPSFCCVILFQSLPFSLSLSLSFFFIIYWLYTHRSIKATTVFFFKLAPLTTILPCFLTSSQQRFWTLFVYQRESFPWSLQRRPTVFSDPSPGRETSWVTAHIIWGIKWRWEHRNSKQNQHTTPHVFPSLLQPSDTIRYLCFPQKLADSLLNNVIHYWSL